MKSYKVSAEIKNKKVIIHVCEHAFNQHLQNVFKNSFNNYGVAEDTHMLISGGQMKTLKEIVENKIIPTTIISYDEAYKISPATLINCIDLGVRDTVKIALESGCCCELTPNQKVIVYKIRDYYSLPANQLTIGMNVCVSNIEPVFGKVLEEHAYMIGLLLGDHPYGDATDIYFRHKSDNIWKYIAEHYESNIKYYSNIIIDNKQEYKSARLNSLWPLVKKTCIYNKKTLYKQMPKKWQKYNEITICKLLAGIYDSMGVTALIFKKRNRLSYLSFVTENEQLLDDIQIMLYKIGVRSVKKKHDDNKKYVVIISSDEYRKKLCKKILPYILDEDHRYAMSHIINMNKRHVQKWEKNTTDIQYDKIVNIEYSKNYVYNITLDKNHIYLANHVVISNI